MKTFGYLLMAVMACMTCSCRDEEPLPDPVPPVMEPENPGNPEEPDTGKVYLGIAPIIENMQEQRAVVENWKEGHCLGVTAAGDVNIPFTFDGRRWKAEKQVEVTAEQKVSAYYPYNVGYCTPIAHLYYQPEGSSEWKLLRCDTEYLFNRNYPGSESAKMDEAFNYLYVIPKSW